MADLVQNTSQLLRAGYGVEDIALAANIPVADLRFTVTWLRQTGQLRQALGLPPLSTTRKAGQTLSAITKEF